jgi:hypothetical protein
MDLTARRYPYLFRLVFVTGVFHPVLFIAYQNPLVHESPKAGAVTEIANLISGYGPA